MRAKIAVAFVLTGWFFLQVTLAQSRISVNAAQQLVACPSVSIVASGPTVFCAGDSVILTAVGGNKCYTYLWTTGQTTKSIVVKVSGTYGVQMSLKNGFWVATATPVTVTANSLITDLNVDGSVDILDYIIFLGKFNDSCQGCPEDFVVDGLVDIRDYLRWVSDIFKVCN